MLDSYANSNSAYMQTDEEVGECKSGKGKRRHSTI